MRNSTERDSPVQSVDRAVTILDLLADAGELGVTELARRLDVHKSTASRLVAALERWDLVEQIDGRGKYRLGVGLLRLAGTAVAGLDVVEQARPVCRRLAAETGLTVNLAVLSDQQALYLDQVAGTSALQSYNWVGQRIPLHATSNGKVLLSGVDRHTARALAGELHGIHRQDDRRSHAARGGTRRDASGRLRDRRRRTRGRALRDRRAGA